MPKKLDRARGQILEAAAQLFLELGYDQVDMRTIASRANTAVGTVYNYFPNKEELFARVFESSWQEVFQTLATALDSAEDCEAQLLQSMVITERAFIARRQLACEMLKRGLHEKEQQQRLQRVGDKLYCHFTSLLARSHVPERFQHSLAASLVHAVWAQAKEHTQPEDIDTEFYAWLVSRILVQKGEAEIGAARS